MRTGTTAGVVAAVVLAAAPAAAQFSDSYSFLKAVREADGQKVQDALNKPGSTMVNTRDQATGESPLHIVTKRRDVTWLGFILGKGGRPDLRDNAGNTPLMLAAQLGWTEGAEVLARVGPGTVNLGNAAGETPLIAAVQRRDVGLVRTLLAAGANPAQADRVAGKSARDYAREDARAAPLLKLMDEVTPKKPVQGPKL